MSEYVKSSLEFDKAYQQLNAQQKLAVDALEGPVLVIAGPGTGKTQILAIRIGNILLNTDTDPKNILCLTYTDSGASAMRQRLIQFIGPTAYEVVINTFHSFCHSIIRENPDVFDRYSEFEVISELEKSQVLASLLEGLDRKDILYKYHGKYEYEYKRLSKLFSLIKKENFDTDRLMQDIEDHLEEMKMDDSMIYKRKTGEFKAGDLKVNKYESYCQTYERTKSAIRLYSRYRQELDNLDRFEYEDLIQWVIQKFETDDNLLAKYQERFQYILVDEYQDTNGAQNKILFQLLSFFESSNVFAVGDDDQAIFRFQGANVQNMMDFDNQYKPSKIVLVDNYRSSQIILDTAEAVISNNRERLTNKDSSLSKNLRAARPEDSVSIRPVFTEYQHQQAEVLDVSKRIEELLNKDVKPSEIAVLFRKNKEAEAFIKLFESKSIPYQFNRDVNVLNELLIQHLLNILNYIVKEFYQGFEQDALLYKILHAPFIQIQTEDISRMAWFLQSKRKASPDTSEVSPEFSLAGLIGNPEELKLAGIKEIEQCQLLHDKLNELCKQILDFTPQGMFEKILVKFNVLNYILHSEDKIQYLQIVNSFFDFLKNETRKNPTMGLIEFQELVSEHIKNNIVIPNTQFIGTKKGVVLSTIHGSKGLEYEYVFMINCSNKEWTSKTSNAFKLPAPYENKDINSDEDNRRLFYVGLTRAKFGIYVSYNIGIDKKADTVCKFVAEMMTSNLLDIRKHQSEEIDLIDQLIIDLSPLKKNYTQLDEQLFEKFIEKFRLNPTALTKYLDCPLSFYYEKVLQVPGARTAALGFGNAVHYALESFMRNPLNLKQRQFSNVLSHFQKGMSKYKSHFTKFEFEQYLNEGNSVLPGFLESFADEWLESLEISAEQKIHTEFENIPISGKLDRIDKTKQGTLVVDYKTGKPNISEKVRAPGEKYPNGSDYWLQMVFYAILLKCRKPSSFSAGLSNFTSAFYFVNQSAEQKYLKAEVTPNMEEIQFVEELIKATYDKIINRQFAPGCGKPTCDWCRYVNSGVKVSLSELNEEEEEID